MEKTVSEHKVIRNDVLVTIIIPAHNEAQTLGGLLASLAELQFPREQLEIIVVDHESDDGTINVARRGGARVVTKRGGTISSVRNHGASAAAGQILAFVDADCTVAEDWLDRALPHFTEFDVGAVGNYHLTPAQPATWVRRVLQVQSEKRQKTTSLRWLPAGNILVRSDVFRECNGFDESLTTCEDVDLSYRIAQKYRVVVDTNIRCWHHGEPTNLWEVFRKELWRGRDNFRGVFRHGLQLAEVPSLLLPLYFLSLFFLLGVLVGTAALTKWEATQAIMWISVAALAPLVMLAGVIAVQCRCLHYLPHFTVFYAVYFLARGLAPLYEWRNV